jgi:hypothetical protein
MTTLTIFVLGPSKTGKSTISNILSDLAESLNQEYQPTQGVRIIEFQLKIYGDVKKNQKFKEAVVDGILC